MTAEEYLIENQKDLIEILGITDVSENKSFTWDEVCTLMEKYALTIAGQAHSDEKERVRKVTYAKGKKVGILHGLDLALVRIKTLIENE